MLRRCLLPAAILGFLLAAAPASGAPVNDLVANATPLGLGASAAVTQTTLGATSVAAEPGTATAPPGCARMGDTVWFKLRGNGHTLQVSTAGSMIDTVLAIYDTADTPNDANRADCDDDGLSGGKSRATVASTVRGNTYLVQLGGKIQPTCNPPFTPDECAPSGQITVTAEGTPRPDNDNRSAARAISTGTPVVVDNTGATSEPGERVACGAKPYAATIWFSWTAPDPGTPSFDASAVFTGARPADTVMTVYRAAGGAVVGCNDDAATPAGRSRVTLSAPVARGEVLLVQVGAGGADVHGLGEGPITVQAALAPPAVPRIAPPPDVDGDGFSPPDDCKDENAAINPRAPEVRGNAEDENCDGKQLPFLRITSGIVNRWLVFREYTKVTRLTVRDAPVGAVARVRCKGKGCPRKAARRKSTGGRELRFAGFFDDRRLRPGAVVEVRVTLAGRIGKVVRYRIRDRKRPRAVVRCLMPGRKKPSACPRAT